MPINPNLPIQRPPLTKGGREAQEVIRTVRDLSQQRARAEPKDTAIGVRPAVVFGQTIPGELPPAPTLATPAPKTPVISGEIGQPITVNLPGSTIKLPVTRTPIGSIAILWPKIVLGRGTRFPSLVSPNPLAECMKTENRAICLLNASVNAAILAASRGRVPAGTVTFFPGRWLPVITKPKVKPGRIPKRPTERAKPVTIVEPPLKVAKPSGPFRRDRPFERSKPVKRSRPPEKATRIPPVIFEESAEIGDFPATAPATQPAISPKISPEILTSPEIGPQIATQTAVLPKAGAQVSTATAASTGRATGRRTGAAGGSLLPFLLRSAAASVPGLFFGRAASLAPATATELVTSVVTPTTPVTVATALPGPSFAGSRPRTRAARECQEVKRRKRRKNKCREGFFEELPGSTRFITWRTVDCRTRRTTREFT